MARGDALRWQMAHLEGETGKKVFEQMKNSKIHLEAGKAESERLMKNIMAVRKQHATG